MEGEIEHWVGEFGIIIPCKSRVVWHQQTCGVCCSHVYIEGIFIPIDEPMTYNNKTKRWIKHLDRLTSANYNYRKKEVIKIWKEINNCLDFEYKDIEGERNPSNQEAIKWIKITKLKYPKKKGRTKLDKIVYERGCKDLDKKWKSLINKEVILVYPNCD